MTLDLLLVRSCMFALFQQMLDLDTGDTVPIQLAPEEVESIKHGLIIPLYSQAPFCQAYLSMLKSQLNIVSECGLSEYPPFPYERDPSDVTVRAFLDKAMEYLYEIDAMLLEDKASNTPRYDTSFPTYQQYFWNASLQVAKDWCNKEGYEWVER